MSSPVRRVLVYVVPCTGVRLAGPVDPTACHDLPIYKPPMNALQYPMEANLRSSVEEMLTRLRGRAQDMPSDLLARMWKEACGSAGSNGKTPLADHLIEAAQDLLGEYRRNRAYAVVLSARRRLDDGNTAAAFVTSHDGAIDDCARALDSPKSLAWVPRLDPAELTGKWDAWRWGLAAAERLLQCLSVHLRHLADHEPSAGGALSASAKSALVGGDRAITEAHGKVLAVIETAHGALQTRVAKMGETVSPAELASEIDQMYTDLHVPTQLLNIIQEASGAYVKAVDEAGMNNGWTAESVITRCLAIEVVTRVYASPAQLLAPLPPEFAFLRLGPDSMGPLVGGAQFAHLGDKKLYGLRLGHFGAFVDPDWRKSDFVWGRLDAAHHLLSIFPLSPAAREDFERRLHLAILKEEVPHVDDEPQATSWLEGHLAQAHRPDTDILRDVVQTDNGKQLMRDLAWALVRIVNSTLPPDTQNGGLKVPWRKAVQVGRIVFAPHTPDGAGILAWVLRPLTIWPRRRARRALNTNPRDLHPQVVHAFVGNVGGAVLLLIALAVLITWLASRG